MHCKICSKRLDLAQQIIGKCRCESYFCSSHRYPSSHNCPVSCKISYLELLKKRNPSVQKDKVTRI